MKWALAFLLAGSAYSQDKTAQEAVEALVNGDFPALESRFTPEMKAALPAAKLQTVWASFLAASGPFERQLAVKSTPVGSMTAIVVTCQFKQMVADVRIAVDASGRIAGLHLIPPSQPPSQQAEGASAKLPATVAERPLEVAGLPGTLTLPKTPGPFPAVVLVHGSGPQDRDETIGPNKPFRDLAWGLAVRGIAVLRYEKRTHAHPEQFSGKQFTVDDETVSDAIAAANLLMSATGIDSRRVFILGHSLGGTMAPRIAGRDPKIAGLIIMAGASRPLEDVLLDQLNYLGVSQADDMRAQVARIKEAKQGDAAVFGAPGSYWVDLRGYHPAAVAKTIGKPILILRGERDYQVTAKELAGWRDALASYSRASFKTYPTLNHLFLPGEGKPGPAEYSHAGHIPNQVLDDIAAWIMSH